MRTAKVTEDSYCTHLPFSAVCNLASFLDPGKLWEKLAVNIPKKLNMLADGAEFEPKYSQGFVALIEQRGSKMGGSSTRTLLNEWFTQNVKVKHLVSALTRAELYGPADYLAVDILKGVPVPRPVEETAVRHPGLECENKLEKENIQKCAEESTLYVRKQSEEFSMSSGPESRSMAYVSVNSGFPSANLDAACPSSNLREPGESDEMVDTANLLREITEDGDIRLRRLDYSLLKHITDDFNGLELSKGGNMIGRGGFGTVYLGRFTTGFQVAVKCLKDDNEEVDNLKQFTTELEVLAKYRHVNIVHLLGYSQEECNHCLVYQYMPNGSLEDRLACRNNTDPLPCQLRIKIAQGTARGINYLNNEGFVHRDIKSANVLLDVDFIPKVGDFATARAAPKGTGMTDAKTSIVIGTSAYLAPEAYNFDVSAKLDTFSFGVVLLELLTGLPTYDPDREDKDIKSHVDENSDDVMDLVDKRAGSWREEIALKVLDLAERCVEGRKKKRPLVGDILPELEQLSNAE